MKLSTKGRYGARLMLDLAIHNNNGPVFLKDIAKRQEISEKYLGHIIPSLKAAGLIASSRGAHGGYILSKPPTNITLAEIVEACEGKIAIVECVINPKICNRTSHCVTRDIWEEINNKVFETLESITLQDMVDRYANKQKFQALMYGI